MNNDNRLTIPLTPELINWVHKTSKKMQISQSKFVREILETIRQQHEVRYENIQS